MDDVGFLSQPVSETKTALITPRSKMWVRTLMCDIQLCFRRGLCCHDFMKTDLRIANNHYRLHASKSLRLAK